MTRQVKTCKNCGIVFERPQRGCNNAQWQARQYCHRGCHTALRNRERGARYAANLLSMYEPQASGCWHFRDIPIIRSAGEDRKSIASRYGITTSLVGQIQRGTAWKHVP